MYDLIDLANISGDVSEQYAPFSQRYLTSNCVNGCFLVTYVSTECIALCIYCTQGNKKANQFSRIYMYMYLCKIVGLAIWLIKLQKLYCALYILHSRKLCKPIHVGMAREQDAGSNQCISVCMVISVLESKC